MGGFGAWGALIQRGQQWADKGIGWAIANKQRQQYISSVRHLRRREYQDMMFSMKEAGLNPILASGATPGHSAAFTAAVNQQSPGVDVAGAVSKVLSAKAQSKQADVAESVGLSGNELRSAQREGIGQSIALGRAQTAKTLAETELALQESGTAAIRRILMQRQAEHYGASARAMNADIPNISSGLKYGIQGQIGRGLRNFFGDSTAPPQSAAQLLEVMRDPKTTGAAAAARSEYTRQPDIIDQIINYTRGNK